MLLSFVQNRGILAFICQEGQGLGNGVILIAAHELGHGVDEVRMIVHLQPALNIGTPTNVGAREADDTARSHHARAGEVKVVTLEDDLEQRRLANAFLTLPSAWST